MIRRMSEVVRELLLGILVYGALVEILILLMVEQKADCSLGLFLGLIAAVAMVFHMERTIGDAVELPGKAMNVSIQKSSMVRYSLMAMFFIAVILVDKDAFLACFIGTMGLKVAAYLQPFTHKILTKAQGGRRDSNQSKAENKHYLQ